MWYDVTNVGMWYDVTNVGMWHDVINVGMWHDVINVGMWHDVINVGMWYDVGMHSARQHKFDSRVRPTKRERGRVAMGCFVPPV